jgi:NAD(P) transhydrogenase subunit alpha
MSMLTIGVVRESAPGERRVALVPGEVARLQAGGMAVVVEAHAGAQAWFVDDQYAQAGAEIVARDELLERADVIVIVGAPDQETLASLRPGQTLLGMLTPLRRTAELQSLAERGVTLISFDGLPRTASRAQGMDALTSQANVAGYKAVLLAANTFGRYFPMLITAAGTARPARVLVLGAGVAGLQAIGTARRLGAVVSAYDVRPQAQEDIESVGAEYVDLGVTFGGAGEGGYARPLTEQEQQELPEALAAHVARADVVITTAQVPGRAAPLLVNKEAVKSMNPGSVIVDLAASRFGGNVALSVPGQTVVTDNGVTIVGVEALPATLPTAASAAYSRNVANLLLHLVSDGELCIDLSDEIQAGVVLAHGGAARGSAS